MTVAAVVLAASTESALADVEGVPRVRRLADVAWAGGAVPIVVVAPDASAAVAAALLGAPVTLVPPAAPEAGSVGQILRGIERAFDEISDTDAALIWPARIQWLDAETVTSLIEAHGQHPAFVLRPTYEGDPGWPVLLPRAEVERLRAIAPTRTPDEILDDLFAAGAIEWRIDLGDPGATNDASVARENLPAFFGPDAPQSGHHEWGAAEAAESATAEEPALAGPGLAPFGQANEVEDPAADADVDADPDRSTAEDRAREADAARLEP